jgi:hypothetical protein
MITKRVIQPGLPSWLKGSPEKMKQIRLLDQGSLNGSAAFVLSSIQESRKKVLWEPKLHKREKD